MKHLGDITKINGHEVPLVDIVTGGSPCQDLSVAGKRAGLDGERSGLFMEQIRIIKEMRDESRKRADGYIRPRFMVWENVPGALSSNNGEDFRVVLEETVRVVDKDAVIPRLPEGQIWTNSGAVMGDGWSVAWRIHDLQFWGCPRDVEESHLSQILEEHPLQKYSLSGRACQGILNRAKKRGKELPKLLEETLIAQSHFRNEQDVTGGVKESSSNTIGQEHSPQSTINPSCNQSESVVYGISSDGSNAMLSDNPYSGIYEADTTRTLDLNGGNPNCNQGGDDSSRRKWFKGFSQGRWLQGL